MAHEIRRVLAAFSARPWFLDGRYVEQMMSVFELRSLGAVRAEPYRDQPAEGQPAAQNAGSIAIVRLCGPIMPRAEAVTDVSSPACVLTNFQRAFRQAASDPRVSGIVIDIYSSGGQVDLVPETVAMIRAARRADRPIVAIANSMAMSAAYWIGCGADEFVVTPSGEVGSIGAYVVHEDVSRMLEAEGVKMTFVYEGPRKTEANPFEPLGDEAKAHLQANTRAYYGMFVADVAKARKVPVSLVRADPVTDDPDDKSFGGGRYYGSAEALRRGMVDRIATIDEVVAGLQKRATQRGRSTASARAALL
ncbi:MAG: S49 family peptidase [Mesorhizobium sp.]|uniref:S49 family peptidase n=1 Tax=Mesorhizobium sp. TaxID=1871066 RepID=UPI001213B570|nr:S49 family peptidase [Mesorhizobium sp.]TIN41384.1 MAG: S49 family peptidase [Mesorhizobium sp.]TJU86162.1 MAG: S49 family peptidase [Mesorhizobium sp.]